MVMNPMDAVSAYKRSGGMFDSLGGSAPAAPAGGTQEFGAMVKDFLGDAVTSLHAGENAAAAGVAGKADLASVVTAMDNAEIVLTEITTIRDKVISAYQTITSSAI